MDQLDKKTVTLAKKTDVTVRWMGEIEEFGRHNLKKFTVNK